VAPVPRSGVIALALVAWILLLGYGFLLATLSSSSLVPIALNLAVAAGLVAVARLSGVRWNELGLSSEGIGAGLRWGIPVALIAMAVPLAVAFLDPGSFRCGDTRVLGFGLPLLVAHVLVRIPLGTALAEEVMFRGVLFAWLRRGMGATWAVAGSAVMFSLWHTSSTLALVDAVGPRPGCPGRAATLAVTLGSTAVAGVGFAVLRLLGRGLLAPILAHAAINAAGLTATYLALSR
jgi:membrane protease YdiL (CAAX protease family)